MHLPREFYKRSAFREAQDFLLGQSLKHQKQRRVGKDACNNRYKRCDQIAPKQIEEQTVIE